MNTAEYCRSIAAPDGSSNYYAFLFHPEEERRALSACFAFLGELLAPGRAGMDPAPVLARLQWWREQLHAPPAQRAPHPVLLELARLEAPGQPSHTDALAASVEAALQEAAGFVPGTFEDWHSHCARLAGAPWALAATRLQPTRANGQALVGLAALCTQSSQLLDFAARARSHPGRLDPLPRDLIGRHGEFPLQGAGANLEPALGEIASRLGAALAGHLTDPLPQFAAVLGRMHLRLMQRCSRHPAQLRGGRPTLTPLRKLWIAWRARA